MRRWSLAVAVLVLIGVLAGCGKSGGPEQVVELDALSGNMFGTKAITVGAGSPVKLLLHNKDSVTHDFVIDKISVSGKKSQDGGDHAHGSGPHADLHVGAQPGTTGTLQFTPKKKGTYDFYCAVPGHKDAGMVGQLTVN